MTKTPSECLETQLSKYGLLTAEHQEAIDKYLLPIFDAMDDYADAKVSQQRLIMSSHLNMRNVPRP